ncbi:hypothetical protein GX441_02520 [bacterium]|nr:hypothetical protein [bacterium]
MILQYLAAAHEAARLGLERCKREGINGDVKASLERSLANIDSAVKGFCEFQGNQVKFAKATMKFNLHTLAAMDVNIEEVVKEITN